MSRYVDPIPQYFLPATGAFLVGGSLYFYLTGTTTLAITYSDAGITIPNVNPLVLGASGSPSSPIFLDPAVVYRAVLKDSTGATVFDADPIGNFAPQSAITALAASTAASIATLTAAIAASTANQFPVGTIYTTVSASFSPSAAFGGTWAKLGAGRCLIGQDTSQTEFTTIGQTGGEKVHVLTAAELATHHHAMFAPTAQSHAGGPGYDASSGSTLAWERVSDTSSVQYAMINSVTGPGTETATLGITADIGSSTGHNTLPPYYVVIFWQRTA